MHCFTLTAQYEIDEDASSSVEVDYVNDHPVIEVDDSGTPVCPPPVSRFPVRQSPPHSAASPDFQFNHPEACHAKACRSDLDCLGGNAERACCWNGYEPMQRAKRREKRSAAPD